MVSSAKRIRPAKTHTSSRMRLKIARESPVDSCMFKSVKVSTIVPSCVPALQGTKKKIWFKSRDMVPINVGMNQPSLVFRKWSASHTKKISSTQLIAHKKVEAAIETGLDL